MAERSTMSWLIARVRFLIRDTGSVLFSDDEDIQNMLDEDRFFIDRHLLQYDKSKKLYSASYGDFEGVATHGDGSWTGGSIIAIYESTAQSADEVTPNTWNLRSGDFGFTTAQTDTRYYLSAWVYDPYLAASKLCEVLTLEQTLTPGAGETGGAIVGRYDYSRAAYEFSRRSKPRQMPLQRIRSNRHS